MKREIFVRSAICAAFIAFVLCLGAQTARAQDLRPTVDCVEPERDANGALTGKYIAHFGYINYAAFTLTVTRNTAGNLMSPVRSPPGQPDTFLPGVHPRVFSVTLDMNVAEKWQLSTNSVTATFASEMLCDASGANARLMTYQGRLSDGSQAANGVYDLQFKLFAYPVPTVIPPDTTPSDPAYTNSFTVEDATVANGIFTVQLNLGANAIGGSGNNSRALNPAILAGKDGFLEIGVRPGNSSGNFTILTPRQPLTAVPFAMQSNTANNAVRALYADNSANLGGTAASQYVRTDSAGSGTIGGNLTIVGTIASGCRSGFTAIADGRLCVSTMQAAATFYGANGATQTCINMGARVGATADVTLSLSQSGFNYLGGLATGWLGDNVGDNLRPRWNANVNNGDFDGASINVYNGGNGGTAPQYQYRCVY